MVLKMNKNILKNYSFLKIDIKKDFLRCRVRDPSGYTEFKRFKSNHWKEDLSIWKDFHGSVLIVVVVGTKKGIRKPLIKHWEIQSILIPNDRQNVRKLGFDWNYIQDNIGKEIQVGR